MTMVEMVKIYNFEKIWQINIFCVFLQRKSDILT